MGAVLGVLAKCFQEQQPQQGGGQAGTQYQVGNVRSQVLFFPDGELPCRSYMRDGVRTRA